MAIHLAERAEATCLLVGEMLYAYYAVMRLGKGIPRLLALAPLLPLSLAVPWRAPSAMERGLQCFIFVWLVGFKLLLLAWGRGPGVDPLAISSFPRFFNAMMASLPVRPDRPRWRQTSDATPTGSSREDAATQKSGVDSPDPGSHGSVRRRIRGPDGEEERESRNGAAAGAEERIRNWTRSVTESQSATTVVLRTGLYFVVVAALARVALAWRARAVSEYAQVLLYGFLIYLACLFLFDAAGAVPASVTGSRFHPNFNKPFLATSLADFWGRRWNLLVNRLLRASVYDPVRELVGGGGALPRGIAVEATFLVSGLMHELIFFYVNRTRPSWEMTAFFVVNGVATAVEELLTMNKSRLPPMPMLARRIYAMGFVYLTACWLFFPPLVRTGVIDDCLRDIDRFVRWTTPGDFLLP